MTPPYAVTQPWLRYWRRNVRLILCLLAVWLLLAMAPAMFTQYLDFSFISWPFPFWLAAYGAPMGFLILVVAYAWIMNRRDARMVDEARGQEPEQP